MLRGLEEGRTFHLKGYILAEPRNHDSTCNMSVQVLELAVSRVLANSKVPEAITVKVNSLRIPFDAVCMPKID